MPIAECVPSLVLPGCAAVSPFFGIHASEINDPALYPLIRSLMYSVVFLLQKLNAHGHYRSIQEEPARCNCIQPQASCIMPPAGDMLVTMQVATCEMSI